MENPYSNMQVFISEEKIQKRVSELARLLTERFEKKSVVAVCVLKGSFLFYSDLVRQIELDITCDFFGISSYQGTQSSGAVKVNLDLSTSVENKHVLLIEDIVDTGLTMNYLKQVIKARNPLSITSLALLEKPEALKVPCELDYVGFQIKNDFVVGYGLDYQGLYRNLPYIAIMDQLN